MDQTVLDLPRAGRVPQPPSVGDRVELITPNRQAPNHLVRVASKQGFDLRHCLWHPSFGPQAYVDGHAEIETSFPIENCPLALHTRQKCWRCLP